MVMINAENTTVLAALDCLCWLFASLLADRTTAFLLFIEVPYEVETDAVTTAQHPTTVKSPLGLAPRLVLASPILVLTDTAVGMKPIPSGPIAMKV